VPRGRNDYETAQIQGRLWSPAVLRPFGWWDAADISTIAQSGGVITQWSDKSGNGRHATGGAATYSVESFNGLNAVSFSGSTNMLVTSAGSSAVAMVAAVRPTASGAGSGSYRGICATDGGSGAGSMLLAKVNNEAWGTFGSSINRPSSGDNPLVADKNYILVMDGLSSGAFAQNGADAGTYSGTEGQTGSHIGGFSSASQGFTGFICEIAWFSAAMSLASRRAVEGYLSWKWAIPLAADHPFSNRPPLIGD
jgi:hypothetical protein